MVKEDKKERMKQLLRRIHEGEGDVEGLKGEFKELLDSISPEDIPAIEQDLVKEGVTPDEIAEMCDVHLDLFRESVEKQFGLEEFSEGHPLFNLYRENEEITKDAETLTLNLSSIREVEDTGKLEEEMKKFSEKVSDLLKIDRTHYTRQEMIIFPHIEKRGIEAVPRVLWRKHDENMNKVKKLLGKIKRFSEKDEQYLDELEELTRDVSRSILDMVFRENNILYPTLKELLSEGEWAAVAEQEVELGYYKIEPEEVWEPTEEPVYPYDVEKEISEADISELPEQLRGMLAEKQLEKDTYDVRKKDDFEVGTGYLTKKEVDCIFSTLPSRLYL